ncbi:MAG: hypothetical protein R3B06_27575 [Kofleriaceae bacterium]
MLRVAASVALGVLACSGANPRATTPTVPTSPGGSPATGGPRPGPRTPTHAPTATPPVAALDPAGADCPAPGCVFHGGIMGGAYFACLSSGAGACFHFGARCAPADGCMYDPGTASYRACAAPSEGTCAAYGAPCQPAAACAYDARDGLHRTCEAWTKGTCARWGALCAP